MGRIYSGALAAEPVVVYLCVPTLCGSYFPSESVARTFHRKGYKAMRVAQEMNRKACIRFGVLMATVFLTVPALLGFFIYRTTDTMTFSVNKSEFVNTLDVEQITWDRGTSAGILAAGQCRANFVVL